MKLEKSDGYNFPKIGELYNIYDEKVDCTCVHIVCQCSILFQHTGVVRWFKTLVQSEWNCVCWCGGVMQPLLILVSHYYGGACAQQWLQLQPDECCTF